MASSSCLVRVHRQQPQVETISVVHVRIAVVGDVVVDGDIVDFAVADVVEVGLDYEEDNLNRLDEVLAGEEVVEEAAVAAVKIAGSTDDA